ncbi:MAG: ABC transporter ATP-binding protein, partial [Polaromonas sp.]
MNSVAIDAHSIRASLGNVEVLHDISLALPLARWTSIVGPNGAGKSTLLKVLAGLLVHRGDVALLGRPLTALRARQRAQQMSWLGQNESSADDLIVYDVAMLGRLPHQAWLAPPSDADRAAVERALRATQAWDWRGRPLSHLSGGERQRV